MGDAVSVGALVIALAVALWQRRVVIELRAIRDELHHLRYRNGGDV